jgi:hypothetical protein
MEFKRKVDRQAKLMNTTGWQPWHSGTFQPSIQSQRSTGSHKPENKKQPLTDLCITLQHFLSIALTIMISFFRKLTADDATELQDRLHFDYQVEV